MVFAPAIVVAADEPFESLFNGENLDGWFTFDNANGTSNDVEEYYKVAEGELVILDIPESDDSKAFGYLSTVDEYADYHLRFEYQWGEKKFAPRATALRDSGVLYHLVGEDRIWPSSLESQVQEGDTGDFFGLGGARITSSSDGGLYSATGTVEGNSSNVVASTVADTLDGWNVSEVVVRGDSAVHIVNGQVVNRIWDATLNGETLSEGRIAFQAEGATIRYRNIELRNLKSSAPRLLLFSETRDFRHDSIPEALDSVEELATSAGFDVDRAGDSADVFTDSNLAGYDAVVWVMTTGDVLDDEEQAAFEHYIRSGGGYAGIHSASDTEYDWPWYGDLVGAWFSSHPEIQGALQNVEDQTHPSTEHLGATWTRTDEWYDFQTNPRAQVNVLLSLDESSYSGGQMGDDHPIAWYHEYDGGRSWYTGGGHTIASYAEEDFRAHLLGGIRYAAGTDGVDGEPPSGVPEDALDRSEWIVTASQSDSGESADNAIDADSDTRWSTGTAQSAGQWFLIDLGELVSVDRLVLATSADQPFDYPRGYEVTVSDDGVSFSDPIASGVGSATTDIALGDTTARYLRIEQTSSDVFRWWSIYDVIVYGEQ